MPEVISNSNLLYTGMFMIAERWADNISCVHSKAKCVTSTCICEFKFKVPLSFVKDVVHYSSRMQHKVYTAELYTNVYSIFTSESKGILYYVHACTISVYLRILLHDCIPCRGKV